jgi:hypothetical protein
VPRSSVPDSRGTPGADRHGRPTTEPYRPGPRHRWAQAHGDLATIAALRETSILIAALIATLLFRERFGRLRLTAGAAVLAGIVVLELAHRS